MASYDKLVKYLADKFQAAVSPLGQITQNQEIIIAQNKQIISLLVQLNEGRIQSTDTPDNNEESEAS